MSEICQQLSDSFRTMSAKASEAEEAFCLAQQEVANTKQFVDELEAERLEWKNRYTTLATAHIDLTYFIATNE